MLTRLAFKKIKRLGERSAMPRLADQVQESVASGHSKVIQSEAMGLVVFRPIFSNGILGLFIWVAIAGNSKNTIKRYLPFFEKTAKDAGGKFIQFETRRKGFSRYAPKFGFKEIQPRADFSVFRKEV